MKTRILQTRILQLSIGFVALVATCASARADWKVHPRNDYSEEVRVWASSVESGLDFSWSGKTNARHEAEGYGILEWHNPATQTVSVLVYTGEMKAGRRHGTGVALYRSGSKYSGEWSADVKEGKGEYWYSNGDYYAGLFHNDLMDGPGRYASADGTIFEGTFVADERDGSGFVIYPDGRRYESTWSAGKDTNPAGAPVSAKPYVMLGVDVHRYALDGKILAENVDGRGDESYLTYRGRLTDGDLVIDPNWGYWVAWSKGGPVRADDEKGDFDIGVHPVFLDIRLFNPGREKLVVSRAEAVVEESFPDLEPILRLQDASSSYGGVTCEIVNFSANPVDDCEVAFNILGPDAPPNFENYQFVEKVEPFLERAKFSLARAMSTLGMDADAIAAIETVWDDKASQKTKQEIVERRVKRGLGQFSKFAHSGVTFSAYGLIAGEVRIAWTDHLGSRQTKRVKFQFRKCFALFWPELGAFGPSSGKYDVLLETEGKDYVVPFAYKRTVAAGGNDRFTLQVASQVSTYQNFRIRLTTADGREIISPRCRMHFLVPRRFSWKEGRVIEQE
jgi:hypothetical protein